MSPTIGHLIPGGGATQYHAAFFDPDSEYGVFIVPVVSFGVVSWGGDAVEVRGFVILDGSLTEVEECEHFCGYLLLCEKDAILEPTKSKNRNAMNIAERVAYFREHGVDDE